MFKVLEVHSAYISSAITFILHLLAAFFFLYILKTSYVDYLPSSGEKRVVWYNAPTTTPELPMAQPNYQQPDQQPSAASTTQYAEVSSNESIPDHVAEHPVEVNPLRQGRSAQDRRSSWSKKSNPSEATEAKELTAGTLVEAISQQQAIRRQAHAVYTKQEAIKQGVAAQMREITDGKLRNKIFSALQIACQLNKKAYYSPVPINTQIITSLVINQKGEIIAVEVIKSTGTRDLDDHIVMLLQSIKKVAIPPSRTGQEFFTQTFTCGVTAPAGSGTFTFTYPEHSGIHIV